MAEPMLVEFAPDLWTVSTELKIAGSEFGTRMTVIRLRSGEVLLIAPCPIDDALASQIAGLGRVAAVIAPNCFHHFYFLDALKRFPEAVPFLADGIAEKIGESPANARPLSGDADPLWKSEIEQCEIPGAPRVNEVVFFHTPSRTLVLTDFCFNFDPPPGGWTGFFLRIAGAHGKLAVSRLMRRMLSDKEAARGAVRRILEWDFDRLIVTHGQNIESDAKASFRAATADL